MLADIGIERAVLAGLCQFGKDAAVEVEGLVNMYTFTDQGNQMLYKCITEALTQSLSIDITSLVAAAKELSLYDVVAKSKKDLEFINSLFLFPIKNENVRPFAKRLAKLEFARKAQEKHQEAFNALGALKGSESIDEIVSISEKPIFDLVMEANRGTNNQPELLTDNMDEYIEFLLNNEIENIGIPTPWATYNAAIGGGLRCGGVNMIGARPKRGKAVPNTSIVYTPTGPRLMGQLKVDDLVCTPFGTVTKVTNIFEHENRDVYRIYFNDGTSVLADLEHLWEVKKNRRSSNYLIMDTGELINSGLREADGRPKWHIRVTEPVVFNKQNLKIDPYILGILIGDGTFRGTVNLTSNDDYISDRFEDYSKTLGLKITQNKIRFSPVKDTSKYNSIVNYIRECGLYNKTSHTKFIPAEYMYSSIEDRKELLRGLFDTDGYAGDAHIEYTTVSETLAFQVVELIQGLGGLCTIKGRFTSYCKDKKFWSYRIRASFKNCKEFFALPRKQSVAHIRTKPLTRKIVKIQKEKNCDCRCITVEDKNALFLIDNFTVTHNSTLCKELAIHVSKNLNIPVLVLDTEMNKQDQLIRSLASESKIEINMIETGKFNKSDLLVGIIKNTYTKLKNNKNFFYVSVAGEAFDNIMSIIRRWIVKHVGFGEDGKTKPCLVIYDYFKLMDKSDLKSLKEYEAMGYQISTFTDFTKEYHFPVMAFVQLNRQEDISQSDRLRWLCQSYSSFLDKTPEQLSEDGGVQNGNRVLTIEDSRYGPGLGSSDYINMFINGGYSTVVELGLKSQLKVTNDNGEDENL